MTEDNVKSTIRANGTTYQYVGGSTPKLDQGELERVLILLPITFTTCDEDYEVKILAEPKGRDKVMRVEHSNSVVSIYPPVGKRLYCATVTNRDFPLRPDNIMDDQIGLRCCYHPRLASFGGNLGKKYRYRFDEIEIDIFKYSREA